MASEVLTFPRKPTEPLTAPGCGRDAENAKALVFYLSRRVTDSEMRFPHDVMQRAVACMPEDLRDGE